jgi:hypothetical protein
MKACRRLDNSCGQFPHPLKAMVLTAQASLKEIENKTVSVDEYINKMSQPFKEKFLETKQSYQLHKVAVQNTPDNRTSMN